MSDKSKNNPEVLETGGMSRRGFLGASAVTGAAVAATAFGGAVMRRESWAAAVKAAQKNIPVAPGERSAARRVGKESGRTLRSRWTPSTYHTTNHQHKETK